MNIDSYTLSFVKKIVGNNIITGINKDSKSYDKVLSLYDSRAFKIQDFFKKKYGKKFDEFKILEILSAKSFAGRYIVIRENNIIEDIILGSGVPIANYVIYVPKNLKKIL